MQAAHVRYEWFKSRLQGINPRAFKLEEGEEGVLLHVNDCEEKEIANFLFERKGEMVIIESEDLSSILNLVGLELQYIRLGHASNLILASGMGGIQ